jgi:hypothetical protein
MQPEQRVTAAVQCGVMEAFNITGFLFPDWEGAATRNRMVQRWAWPAAAARFIAFAEATAGPVG